MKEANCLERGIRPTLNEPDDLRCGTEPKLIARLIWLALPEIICRATFEKLTSLSSYLKIIWAYGKEGAKEKKKHHGGVKLRTCELVP